MLPVPRLSGRRVCRLRPGTMLWGFPRSGLLRVRIRIYFVGGVVHRKVQAVITGWHFFNRIQAQHPSPPVPLSPTTLVP